MRRADGPGDRRVAAQPGRAADRAGAGRGTGRRPCVSGGITRGRPGRPPGRESFGYLLSLVARARLRRTRPAARSTGSIGDAGTARKSCSLARTATAAGLHDRWGRLPSTCLAAALPEKGKPGVRDRPGAATTGSHTELARHDQPRDPTGASLKRRRIPEAQAGPPKPPTRTGPRARTTSR